MARPATPVYVWLSRLGCRFYVCDVTVQSHRGMYCTRLAGTPDRAGRKGGGRRSSQSCRRMSVRTYSVASLPRSGSPTTSNSTSIQCQWPYGRCQSFRNIAEILLNHDSNRYREVGRRWCLLSWVSEMPSTSRSSAMLEGRTDENALSVFSPQT